MLVDPKVLTAEMAADICVERVGRRGTLGVLIEDMPSLDPSAFVARVAKSVSRPTRIAVLGYAAVPSKGPARITLTSDPTIANQWRNDADTRKGTPFITLVRDAGFKLHSLKSATTLLGPNDLRAAVVRRAVELLDSPERRAFWAAVSERTGDFPVGMILDCFAAVSGAARSDAALLDAEPALVWRLGLLQQADLFTFKDLRRAGAAIRRNLDLVARLRVISPRERANVVRLVDTDDEHPLQAAARAMLEFEATGKRELLADLEFQIVLEVLKTKLDDDDAKKGKPRPRRRVEGDALAVELLVEAEGKGLKTAAKRFNTELAPDHDGEIEPDEINVGSRKVLPRLKNGSQQATGAFARVLSAKDWGGIVSAPTAKDFVSALKLLASDEVPPTTFNPTDPDNVRDILQRAVNQAWVDKRILAAWDAYADARGAILSNAAQLTDHPLMAMAGDEKLLARAEKVLTTYDAALAAVKETADALRKGGSVDPAKRLLARALVLDLLFVRSASETNAVAAPTHPFHLWRWVTLARLIGDRGKEIADLGSDILKDLVQEPPPVSPSILLGLHVPEARMERSSPFVCVGSFGALPLFAEPSARNLGKFRARPLSKLAARLLRLMPHAGLGLRVVLVDPLSIAGTLEELAELESPFSAEEPVPLHATIYRTRAGLGSTEEEEEDLEEIARNIHDWGGSISVVSGARTLKEITQDLSANPAHLVVIFQPGEGQRIHLAVAAPPALSPLVVPRAYRYDQFDDRLDVIIAGEGAPFATYHSLFCESLDIPTTDFVGRRSGASRWSQQLAEVSKESVWVTIVDQGLEPTLRLDESLRLDWRNDAGRDIVTFTSRPETAQELVTEAVKLAGLVPTPATVRRTLDQICRLSGEALLALARMNDGTLIDPRVARGTLGVVAAARWYERANPDALMLSLDDALSRRWILGHADTDNRHGDLVGIRSTKDGVIIDAVEVKAYEDLGAALTIRGANVEGGAVDQVDQTIKILRKLLTTSVDELSPLDVARRDILRDHLYRAVASRPYTREQRARLVALLNDLFQGGARGVKGLVFRVKIASNTGEVFPIQPTFYKTPAKNELGVVDIVETEVAEPSKPGGEGGGSGKKEGKAARMPAETGAVPATSPMDSGGRNASPPKGTRARQSQARRDEIDTSLASDPADPRVLIGTSRSDTKIHWEPHRADKPLNNFGILVTGDSGSGKTQALRAIIHDVSLLGIPVCAFDFKNDYADPEFSGPAGLRVYDVSRGGLPFNPLSLLPDEHGETQPITQIHTLAGILRRIFTLGDQQESRLKKAMSRAYESAGIEPKSRYKVADLPPGPSFGDVVSILEEDEKNEPLLNRLSPLFDLNLFPTSDSVSTTFEALMSARVVLDLHSLPDDRIKQAIAEFIIVRLHGYVLRGEQPRKLRRLLVFDEAWRVKDSERLQELAREGRAFGVGIAIGTQFPGDIRENLAGNLATQIFLHNKEVDHQRVIARQLCGAGSGQQATQLIRMIAGLQKYEAFVRNQQHTPYVLVRTTPHHERQYK